MNSHVKMADLRRWATVLLAETVLASLKSVYCRLNHLYLCFVKVKWNSLWTLTCVTKYFKHLPYGPAICIECHECMAVEFWYRVFTIRLCQACFYNVTKWYVPLPNYLQSVHLYIQLLVKTVYASRVFHRVLSLTLLHSSSPFLGDAHACLIVRRGLQFSSKGFPSFVNKPQVLF